MDTMKKAARAHEQTEEKLTAADINALIAANRKSRGTALLASTAMSCKRSSPSHWKDWTFHFEVHLVWAIDI